MVFWDDDDDGLEMGVIIGSFKCVISKNLSSSFKSNPSFKLMSVLRYVLGMGSPPSHVPAELII